MQLRLNERIREAQTNAKELIEEVNDYSTIAMLIRALQAVELEPKKFNYSQEDYDNVLDKLRSLCSKHEIQIPETVAWTEIEII